MVINALVSPLYFGTVAVRPSLTEMNLKKNVLWKEISELLFDQCVVILFR